MDHNTKLKVGNRTSSCLFSRPHQAPSCLSGTGTCHYNMRGRFPVMCGVLWTKRKPGVSLSTTCHTHSVRKGDYCMYTICTVEGRYTWGVQLMFFISAPGCGRYPSGHWAVFDWCITQPTVGVDDWFLALVNNSSGLNAKDAPPIMHCLPSKQRGWEIILKWDAGRGIDGIAMPLSLGPGHLWHTPAP